jgi:hypothetical protein
MKSNKHINKKNNKISLTNIDNISSKRYGDLSLGNLYSCDYSTIVTNSKIYNNKTPNLGGVNIPISPNKNAYNTIEENSIDIFYLSKINLEHDIYLSSLKRKLAIIKEERKKSEANVINAKKKIIELQKEEEKSLNQLENTKKYITKIIENRKKYTNKNFDIKITKINNIFQTNKRPSNGLYHSDNLNCNTWFAHNKKRPIIKPQISSSHANCNSEIENNIINNSYLLYNKIKPNINSSKNNTIESIQKSNLSQKKIYSRKKIKTKNNFINKLKYNTNYSENNNNDKNNITNVNNYINKKKNNNKKFRESLILRLKKNEEEKKKIEKQIEEIEMEENKLYNNFYDNFKFYNSSKTLD